MIHNKIWATEGSQRPCIAKRIMRVKKVMFLIFFTNQGPAIPVAVPKGKSVNAKFYKGKILHKLKKYFKNISGCCITMLRHTKRPLYENI
jgi:hypothetical protein